MTRIIQSLSELHDSYDVLFCDLWGCLHNGITAFPEAVDALRAFRAKGGTVLLLTNSPKPRAGVATQLGQFNVPGDCWDVIATSGDSARAAMFQGAVGEKVHFMGEWARDAGFFEPLSILENPVAITRVPLDQAEGIVCCGPDDPQADPEVNRADFLYAKAKGMKLLCANPDIVVDRGETREWCAGALAKLYSEMGGESLYFGKPHAPIYNLAHLRLAEIGRDCAPERILCVGDGLGTDILGGLGESLDTLFITGGLSRLETGTETQPDPEKLTKTLQDAQVPASYAIGFLR